MAHIWNFPTKIVYGAGEAHSTGAEAKKLGLNRVLIVTDPGVLKAELAKPVQASLDEAGIPHATFSEVDGNPVEANVDAGAAAFAKHEADGIVALGGGSALDAAKLIGVRARTVRPFEELDDAIGGDQHVPPDVPDVIALPTTAGTGSEVGRAGVVTVRSTGRKTVIFAPQLLPRVAILDPELTVSMPMKTTAATGVDALTHCLEAYVAKGIHPMADAIALAGIDLVAKHLPRAVADGSNLEARGAMMQAAMMGAVAFQKGLGACHSLAHPLSSECGLHHGLANALCLPAVVDFNESAVPDRYLHAGLLLGGEAALGECAKALRKLRQTLGIPSGLGVAGVERGQLPKLADLAFADGCHQQNPRPCTRDDLLRMYEASF